MSLPGTPNRCGITAVHPIAATRRAKPATCGVMPGISEIAVAAGPVPSRYTARVLPSWVNSPAVKSDKESVSATAREPNVCPIADTSGPPLTPTSYLVLGLVGHL